MSPGFPPAGSTGWGFPVPGGSGGSGASAHPTLVYTSTVTVVDGTTGSEIRLPFAVTLTGFSFSMQTVATTGTLSVSLTVNGATVATATLASGGNEYSAVVVPSPTAVAANDALAVVMTTLSDAGRPLLAYVQLAA